jgi:hypothetical protein
MALRLWFNSDCFLETRERVLSEIALSFFGLGFRFVLGLRHAATLPRINE